MINGVQNGYALGPFAIYYLHQCHDVYEEKWAELPCVRAYVRRQYKNYVAMEARISMI